MAIHGTGGFSHRVGRYVRRYLQPLPHIDTREMMGPEFDVVTELWCANHDGNRFSIGASVGLRLIGAGCADTGALLREADAAMYEAKKAGRSQVRLFPATS